MKRAFSAAAWENPISTSCFATSPLMYFVTGSPFGSSSPSSSAATSAAASSPSA
tara:strand:- start:217 stop:378 length:162 start_codon:yes stop_codon:yes gene_type:complete